MTISPISPHVHTPRVVYIAALVREVASVVRGWHTDETQAARKIHLYWNDNAVVACAGMGAHRASLAIGAALALGPASELVSVGFAGACSDRFPVGNAIHPSVVVDAKTGERFFISEPDTTEPLEILVTVPSPAGTVEKQRVGIGYYASAVDMEAATVARIAQAKNLTFSAIKTISDGPDFEISDIQRFTTPEGQFRELAFGLYAVLRPWLWGAVLTLAKGSRLAEVRLKAEIEAHILQHRDRKS